MSEKREWPWGYDWLGTIAPWSWLRHVTPWWLLEWCHGRYHLCWAMMVRWKIGFGSSWQLSKSCLAPFDYCMTYDDETPEGRAEMAEAARIIGEAPRISFAEGGDDDD